MADNYLRWLFTGPAAGIALRAALSLLLFAWDPLRLQEQQSRIFDDCYAVVTQFLRPSPAEQKLAVVLIDEATLDRFGHDWPLSYRDLAALGHRIACAGAIAVFFDIVPSRRLNLADGTDELRGMAYDAVDYDHGCAKRGAASPVPAFFGFVPDINSQVLKSLVEDRRTFLIDTSSEWNVYAAGPTEFSDHVPTDLEVTPAFGLLRWFCGRSASQRNPDRSWCPADSSAAWSARPIRLTWSGYAARGQSEVSSAPNCAEVTQSPLWDGILQMVSPEGHRCPPILTLRGPDLYRDLDFINTYRIDPAATLAGRIVFVGVDLPALNDEVISPVHEKLPGVYAHAVAMQNLLAFGGRYPTVPGGRTYLIVPALFYLAVQVITHVFFDTEPRTGWIRGLRRRLGGLALLLTTMLIFGFIVLTLRWPFSFIVTIVEYVLGLDALVALSEQATVGMRARSTGGGNS